MAILEWETVEVGYLKLTRARVLGGWLIKATENNGVAGCTMSITFMPDPDHNWLRDQYE